MDCQHTWIPRCRMVTSAWADVPSMRLEGYDCKDCGTFIDTEEVIGASFMGEGRQALTQDSTPTF